MASVLVDEAAILKVVHVLRPEDFYSMKARWVYEACLALYERSEPTNQVSVTHELGAKGRLQEVGDQAYLSYLIANLPTSVHAEHYGNIVLRASVMRQLIQAAGEIAALGYEPAEDVEGALSKAENVLFRIRSHRRGGDFVHIRDVLDTYLEESAAAAHGPLAAGMAPIPTGFTDLDRLLGGLQRSDMIVLAARPSLGKSTLALNVVRNAAGVGAVVAIFSLEMGREQVVLRLLASEAGVDTHRLRLGLYTEAEEKRIVDAVGVLSDLPIYIDDSPMISIVELRSKARRLQLERRVDLAVVDYMQLLRGPYDGRPENRVQEISEISRSLKGLARDLKVPVLAVSQLSRAVEMRPSHRPQLSDLRDSGSIEQDADVVAFIYRDDVYVTEEEWVRRFPDKAYPQNIAEIQVAKHRHGPLGMVNLYFNDKVSRFETMRKDTG